MQRLIFLLFAFLLIMACNNKNNDYEKGGQSDSKAHRDGKDSLDDSLGGKARDTTGRSRYKWAATEQNKFLKDCQIDFNESVADEKLKGLCLCMLTQAQNYYPGYRQMDEKINDAHDNEIFSKCFSGYAGQN